MRCGALLLLLCALGACSSTDPAVIRSHIDQISANIGLEVESRPDLTRVAVTPIKGSDPDLSWWFCREVESELVARESFIVVERGNLEDIFAEHELVLSDVFDDATRPEVGRLVGADVLVVTEIHPDSKARMYSLRGRAIDLETGRILTSSSSVLDADDLTFSRAGEDGGGGGFFATVGNVFLGILKIPATPVTCILDIFETTCVNDRGVGTRAADSYPTRVVKGVWDGLPFLIPWVSATFSNDLHLTSSMWNSWL